MATYASLTQEQKDVLASWGNLARGWAGEQNNGSFERGRANG